MTIKITKRTKDMFKAIQEGKWHEVLSRLLRHEIIEARDGSGNGLLHAAVQQGDEDLVRWLLNKGLDTTVKNNVGSTPLHLAAAAGREDLLRTLIKTSVDPRRNTRGTPLHEAAQVGSVPCITLLLNAGADVNARDDYDQIPLHRAALHGHLETAEVLITAGSEVSAKDHNGMDSFLMAVMGQNFQVGTLLRAKMDNAEGEDWCRVCLMTYPVAEPHDCLAFEIAWMFQWEDDSEEDEEDEED